MLVTLHYLLYLDSFTAPNSEDHDQMLQNAASDHGLQCFTLIHHFFLAHDTHSKKSCTNVMVSSNGVRIIRVNMLLSKTHIVIMLGDRVVCSSAETFIRLALHHWLLAGRFHLKPVQGLGPFSRLSNSFFLSPSLWETTRYD